MAQNDEFIFLFYGLLPLPKVGMLFFVPISGGRLPTGRASWFLISFRRLGRLIVGGSAVAKYFGVKCQTCETLIRLAEMQPDNPGTIAFYAVPLEPILCRSCGSQYLYGPKDGLVFDMLDEGSLPGQSRHWGEYIPKT